MADFKDVIIRLQENKNANTEAIQTQTTALTDTIVSTTKTQNRSFGQSLSLQFGRNTKELSEIKSAFVEAHKFAQEQIANQDAMIDVAEENQAIADAQADNQQAMIDEAKRNAAAAGASGSEAADAVKDATEKSDKKTKGLFGGLMSGLGGMVGGVGLGGGALLAGAGILLGGGAMLLDKLMDLDGKKVRENVKELVSIKDDFDGLGDFFLTGGTFMLAMTGIGVGLAALSLGSGAAAAVEYFAGDIEWAKSVKTNVKELLSIKDELGGNIALLADGAAFTLAMTGIGVGLAVFGAGSAVAGMSDKLLGNEKFGNPNWAQGIVDNVVTLLSISDEVEGKGKNLIGEGAKFLLAMTGVGAGLAVFGIGGAVASLVTSGGEFLNPDWATQIKDNVVTLLSISDVVEGQGKNLIGESAKFLLSMTGIGAGLAVFGVGSGVATLVGTGGDFVNPDWAQSIVDNVTTLLSISSLPGVLTDSATFVAAMTGIAAGIVAFSAAEGFAAAIGYFSGGDTVDNIKTNVEKAISILEDENINPQKAQELKTTLSTVGEALSSFAGGELGASLKQVGSSILNFLSGGESPVEEMLALAEKDTELLNASAALIRLSSALSTISQLQFDGKNLNMKQFAEDLAESVPVIEAAIMGGTIEKFGLFNDIDFKGLASPDIKYAEATENILALRNALGETVEIPTNADLSNKSNELGSNMNQMSSPAPIFINSDNSTQAVTNNSSRASITMGKSTHPTDRTLNAINSLYEPEF